LTLRCRSSPKLSGGFDVLNSHARRDSQESLWRQVLSANQSTRGGRRTSDITCVQLRLDQIDDRPRALLGPGDQLSQLGGLADVTQRALAEDPQPLEVRRKPSILEA
jgi:hypothetical protein